MLPAERRDIAQEIVGNRRALGTQLPNGTVEIDGVSYKTDRSDRRGRIGGRRKKLDAARRREIAESVISGRKSGADMARLYGVSQPTVSRIVAEHLAGRA